MLRELVEEDKVSLPASAVMAATALRWEPLPVAMVRPLTVKVFLPGEQMDPVPVEPREHTAELPVVLLVKLGMKVAQGVRVVREYRSQLEGPEAQVMEEAAADLNMELGARVPRSLMRHTSMERQSIALRAVLVEQSFVQRGTLAMLDR